MKIYRGTFVLGSPFPCLGTLNPAEVLDAFQDLCTQLPPGSEVTLVRGSVAGLHMYPTDGEYAYHTLPDASEHPQSRVAYLRNPDGIILCGASRGDDGTWRVFASGVELTLEPFSDPDHLG